MKLLILGGTVFLGRHLVEAALARGHEVTIFNRGVHDAGLFAEVERLRGDRREDLSALEGRSFDAVIDTSGYVPGAVRASARLLSENASHYTFISSQSVYENYDAPGLDETHEVQQLTDEQVREAEAIKPEGNVFAVNYGAMYGGLKALCERAVEEEMPGRTLSIRAGLIVGPDDYSDRYTYWVRRVAEGGETLAPGEPSRPVQFVDVRDLSEWLVRMSEERVTGVFNATGPDYKLSMGEMLEACRVAAESDAVFAWVGEEFLKEAEVKGWSEMPLWLPAEDKVENFFSVNCRKAIDAGLTFRSPVETARATLEWDRTREGKELRAGLQRERELELLRAWHSKS
ncbi:MAG: NAD-dependent epimerase/dehydratase family protein [Acidobacteria bacterium]|nr:NAD-dependent epimerase/dehydratase family protein [Acidobacteriota bacterium]